MINSYVVRTVGGFMSAWAVGTGALMVLAPPIRFSSPQWQFIENAPGGHILLGSLLITVAVLMAAGLIKTRRGMVQATAYAVAFMFMALAVAQASAALISDAGGVMGGPYNFFIAMCFLLLGGVVQQMSSPPP